jgi:hypothetical protein
VEKENAHAPTKHQGSPSVSCENNEKNEGKTNKRTNKTKQIKGKEGGKSDGNKMFEAPTLVIINLL